MPDDSLDTLLHSLAVVVLDVVVAQSHPQVLDVVLAHAEMETQRSESAAYSVPLIAGATRP